MSFDILYINGDSYSADDEHISVYGKILAEKINKKYINRAVLGSSNERIFRTTIEDALGFKKRSQKIFALIGLSFVNREEVWAPNDADQKIIDNFNQGSSCKLVTRDSLPRANLSAYQIQNLIDEDLNTQYAHFFYRLYMFINTLENLDIPYFIFSAATNKLSMSNSNLGYILGTNIHQKIAANPQVADMFNLSIPIWADNNNIKSKPTGHLIDSDSHAKFASYLHINYLSSLWQ